jgi:hypothetical protein
VPLDPDQLHDRAVAAINTRWAYTREDRTAHGRRGAAGLPARFRRELREQFPDETDEQIERRVANAYRAHMATMSLKAAKARREAAEARRQPKHNPSDDPQDAA